ncbi:enolase C-terminal domain-like protein [uncultured Algimonas sp.]|uniref:enolase C-terminal domain-like protein n=1 Tax=uncultured Algimonas sp. TaxID=1547920 RepID=UPI002620C5D0|nr:enolase C-terminal domain-like protein [uncultured Algimonas sp.]
MTDAARTTPLNITVRVTQPELVRPFIIATGARTHQPVLSVTVGDGIHVGRGAATGVRYRGESVEAMQAQLAGLPGDTVRETLSDHLPAGGAMAALDAALWELEAARANRTVADLIGVDPRALPSAFTIVLDTPDAMAAQTSAESWRPLLKVKLGGNAALEAARMRAVRRAAPETRLVIDANAAWTPEQLGALAPVAKDQGYELLEQPLPMGGETDPVCADALRAAGDIIPLCADESLQTLADLDRVAPLYSHVNIKLDKCGGLTAGLALRDAARARGLGIFVGCMVAPAVAIAPAHLLAQGADYVDLDGPFWFPDEPVRLDEDGLFTPIDPAVWGAGDRHADDR